MKFKLVTDEEGSLNMISEELSTSAHDAFICEITINNVSRRFEPRDLVLPPPTPVFAAQVVAMWASAPGRTEAEIRTARRFLQQWPNGPQL